MNFDALYQGLLAGVHQMSWLEIIAALFGAISVICSKQNSIWLYPTGLVSTGIYAYLLSREQFKLYAEATLNVYYFIMSVYGWYHWARKSASEPETPVGWATRSEWMVTGGITLIGWALFGYLLRNYSNSDVPVIDAFVSATACAGMWLLAKRKIENWVVLNVSNLVAVPLLFHKHLLPTAVLTIFLFIVAVMGYFSWRKIWREQNAPGLAK
ncbi:nicotinamide riboside transporter PnuC [Chitinophaga pinensis]|uniref:Nicotinamide riboside transporter PnuC n=1 Tax=Chitinophaga pinensis (strain ATCC 43595 / DSM 2588 / LMG 13176 / NBRC 15968 / NCIMB 11800 / UQM 2034) TaxID=485918 RepID=A0A979GNC0_CHIPD|nr:nicotinamide riboside transporter PnuC [Chitinophaga pinensis]ACU58218.1 nicotinamide mononucleotide transporter PnuC [Chitinophaga pinensis DSM 2588]